MILQKPPLYTLVLCFCLVLLFVYQFGLLKTSPLLHNLKFFSFPNISTQTKWIVVTSINYPTEDVKRLASLKDWSVVVVADTKTPKDWNFPGVHFLSVEKQLSLGLSLPKSLPFKTYTRKNVGYLYAIMNGAEWIYDTDDDNKPYGNGLQQFDYGEMVSGLRYTPRGNISEKLFNPYRFFGYKDMWPRGFPLEWLKDHTNGEDRMISCREMKPAAVQQGIVHKDPDVDAVYRLLHADRQTGLNVTFNKYAPPFCLKQEPIPLGIPKTLCSTRAPFSPCSYQPPLNFDIWRSYFSQKMLHLIGESVAFYPVNAVQFRNAHDYLADFKDEMAVYTKSGEIVKYIDSFTCVSTETQKCFMELTRGFASKGFVLPSELPLIEAWIADLEKIGYKFPPLLSKNNFKVDISEFRGNCRSANVDLSTVTEAEEASGSSASQKKVNYFNDLLSWCSQTNETLPSPKNVEAAHKTIQALEDKKDTVLVLINNYPWKQSIGLLQRLYTPYFAATVFCGSWNSEALIHDELDIIKPVNFINFTEEEAYKGHLFYYCTSKVRDMRFQNVKGYYFVADDTAFNIWQPLPTGVSAFVNSTHMNGSWWKRENVGEDAAKQFVNMMEGKYVNDTKAQEVWKKYDEGVRANGFTSGKETMLTMTGRTISDFFYVSSPDFEFFADMSEYLSEARMFVEIATSKIFLALNGSKIDNFLFFFGEARGREIESYNSTIIALHPMKLSSTHTDLEHRKAFCSAVISSFHNSLFQRE